MTNYKADFKQMPAKLIPQAQHTSTLELVKGKNTPDYLFLDIEKGKDVFVPITTKEMGEFIVKAVNNHASLLDACKELLKYFKAEAESNGCMKVRTARLFKQTEQAIQQAEGQ